MSARIPVDLSLSEERAAELVAEWARLSNGRSMTFTFRYGAGSVGDIEGLKRQNALWSLDRVVLLRMRTIRWQLIAAGRDPINGAVKLPES